MKNEKVITNFMKFTIILLAMVLVIFGIILFGIYDMEKEKRKKDELINELNSLIIDGIITKKDSIAIDTVWNLIHNPRFH